MFDPVHMLDLKTVEAREIMMEWTKWMDILQRLIMDFTTTFLQLRLLSWYILFLYLKRIWMYLTDKHQMWEDQPSENAEIENKQKARYITEKKKINKNRGVSAKLIYYSQKPCWTASNVNVFDPKSGIPQVDICTLLQSRSFTWHTHKNFDYDVYMFVLKLWLKTMYKRKSSIFHQLSS